MGAHAWRRPRLAAARLRVSRSTYALNAGVLTRRPQAVRELLMLDPAAIASGQKNPGTQMCTELKLQIKYGRQLGVHVSPTTTWNGMICDTSSGWSAEEWSAFLDPLIEQASA